MKQPTQNQDSSAFSADPELIRALETHAKPFEIGSDQVIFRQGDLPFGIFIVRRGYAVLTMLSGANIVMQLVTNPGSILGLPAAISGSAYSLTAHAPVDSEIDFVPIEDLMHLMHTDPAVSLNLLPILSAEVRAARQAVSAL
jgi:CRP-like cAMP-binding protein